jgi:hypothetical protein
MVRWKWHEPELAFSIDEEKFAQSVREEPDVSITAGNAMSLKWEQLSLFPNDVEPVIMTGSQATPLESDENR